MRIVFLLIVFSFGLLVSCSSQENSNIKEAIEVGKEYKKAIYTVDYSEIPDTIQEHIVELGEKAEPYLTNDELERQITNRLIDVPAVVAENQKVDIAVKDMEFAYKEVPDNTDEKINLSYVMTIELLKEEKVVDEVSFDGDMRVERTEDGWKVDWDRDHVPGEFLRL